MTKSREFMMCVCDSRFGRVWRWLLRMVWQCSMLRLSLSMSFDHKAFSHSVLTG